MRSGCAALIGRPNVGKSTLLNRLLGQKIAIVSPKPQTTRTRILGVVTAAAGQVGFYDTPGMFAERAPWRKSMLSSALVAIRECDLILFLTEAHQGNSFQLNVDERFVLENLQSMAQPVVLVITKIDTVKKPSLLPFIDFYRQQFPFVEVVPISARYAEGMTEFFDVVLGCMPVRNPLFPADFLTDQTERVLVAEYVREQVFRYCQQEIPYSTTVVVESFDETKRHVPAALGTGSKRRLSGLVRIHASIFVERDSQKAILIGEKGQMLKKIGTASRESIKQLLDCHVFLSLQVVCGKSGRK